MVDEVLNKSLNLSLLCWNIANPSEERAGRQALWLRRRPEDVLVLTEVRQSKGCIFLERYFHAFNYNVIFPKLTGNEYGVMIISRESLIPTDFSKLVSYLPSRVVSIKVDKLEIIGVYIPSRGFDEGDILLNKKHFIEELNNALTKSSSAANRIFCGDLNVLEPNHVPHYKYFQEWEYDFYSNLSTKYQLKDAFRKLNPESQEHSWLGRAGDGYRYDHCFVSHPLLPCVQKCYYLHEPRELCPRLSDHSALIIELNLRS